MADPTPSTPRQFGTYELVRELGRGGMGVVHLARDTRLDRPVAIKVLPQDFTRDPERLARFEREARLLASLHHQNIASVHSLEESEGERFLVLELAEGDTLQERISRGPLPVEDTLLIARQIALALEAAHEKGIIHRDLKPANVKVTPDGTVKVLDFGLAKAISDDPSSTQIANSPTITAAATMEGVVLGTAAYMSPEQARGKHLDKRTDIWSFGCVLFECLTGRRTFEGESAGDILARILERDPDYDLLPTNTPHEIRNLLHHCLQKDPKRRLRDIGDATIVLDETIAARAWSTGYIPVGAGAPTRERRGTAAFFITSTLLIGIVLGVAAWHQFRPTPQDTTVGPTPVSAVSVALPRGLQINYTAVSPNGRSLCAIGTMNSADGSSTSTRQIFIRHFDQYDFQPLRGTERAVSTAFSPDGKWLAFVATVSPDSNRSRLWKVALDGDAPPIVLADWKDEWATELAWSSSGEILVLNAEDTRYVCIPEDGGAPPVETLIDKGDFPGGFTLQGILPDGKTALLNATSYGQSGYQISTALLNLDTGKARILIENGSNAVFAPPGWLVFTRAETLLAGAFDPKQGKLIGGPVSIMDDLRTQSSWDNALFSLSENGTLLYRPGGRTGRQRRIVIVNQDGSTEPWSTERRPFESAPVISPDGKHLAIVVANADGIYETWISQVGRPQLRRFLAAPDADWSDPVFSPDGEWLACKRLGRTAEDGIYRRRVNGAGEPQCLLRTNSVNLVVLGWSADDVLLYSLDEDGTRNLYSLTVDADADGEWVARPLLATRFDEGGARFSPDGKWIAYMSNESGRYEVYVAEWIDDERIGSPRRVGLCSAVSHLEWNSAGDRLFFLGTGRNIFETRITTDPALSVSTPQPVLNLNDLTSAKLDIDKEGFGLFPDGRFAIVQEDENEDDASRLNVVFNFNEELRRRVPTGTNP